MPQINTSNSLETPWKRNFTSPQSASTSSSSGCYSVVVDEACPGSKLPSYVTCNLYSSTVLARTDRPARESAAVRVTSCVSASLCDLCNQ